MGLDEYRPFRPATKWVSASETIRITLLGVTFLAKRPYICSFSKTTALVYGMEDPS